MAPKAEDTVPTTTEEPAALESEMMTAPSKADSKEAPSDEEAPSTEETPAQTEDKATDEGAETPAQTDEKYDVQVSCDPSEVTNSFACFDFSTLACCGFGSKGSCSHCETPILYNEESVEVEGEPGKFSHKSCHEKVEQEKLENEKATQIQKVARAKLARDVAQAKKAAAEEAMAKSAAPEAAPEQAPEQAPARAPVKAEKKKGFFQIFAGLFFGCKKADKQVETILSQEVSV